MSQVVTETLVESIWRQLSGTGARLVLSAATFLPAPAGAFTVSVGGPIVGGDTSGHEEVTRQAMRFAYNALQDELKSKIATSGPDAEPPPDPVPADIMRLLNVDLQPSPQGVNGATTSNPLIYGNYNTDLVQSSLPIQGYSTGEFWVRYIHDPSNFPLPNIFVPASVLEHINDPGNPWGQMIERSGRRWAGDWQTNPEGQFLHFLRNYDNDATSGYGLVSARDSCVASRQHILNMSRTALASFKEALKDASDGRQSKLIQAAFYVGMATHTLEDSFSPQHARRGLDQPAFDPKSENFDIRDICYYGAPQRKGLLDQGSTPAALPCYHQWYDIGNFTKALSDLNDGAMGDEIWIMSKDQLDLATRYWAPWQDGARLRGKISWFRSHVRPNEAEDEQELRHEPRLARTATARYLYLLVKLLAAGAGPDQVEKVLMARLFEGTIATRRVSGEIKEMMPAGVMRCGLLDDKPVRRPANGKIIVPVEDQPPGPGVDPFAPGG